MRIWGDGRRLCTHLTSVVVRRPVPVPGSPCKRVVVVRKAAVADPKAIRRRISATIVPNHQNQSAQTISATHLAHLRRPINLFPRPATDRATSERLSAGYSLDLRAARPIRSGAGLARRKRPRNRDGCTATPRGSRGRASFPSASRPPASGPPATVTTTMSASALGVRNGASTSKDGVQRCILRICVGGYDWYVHRACAEMLIECEMMDGGGGGKGCGWGARLYMLKVDSLGIADEHVTARRIGHCVRMRRDLQSDNRLLKLEARLRSNIRMLSRIGRLSTAVVVICHLWGET